MLDVLVSIKDEDGNPRFSADEVTGMFISLMFAGHHTSSGTSAWTLIELIRHPDVYAEVLAELEELYADGQEVSFHALRQIPKLDNVVKETLRLHPPLIILMRVAKGEFEVAGFPIHDGDFVAASPAISNRIPEDFPDPDAFNPDRYNKPEQADVVNRWTWIPFGAGRHRCVGAAFATCRSRRSSRFCCASTSSRWPSPPTATATTTPRWWCSWPSPAKVRYRRRQVKGAHDGLTASKPTWICARATPCASWRHPTTSGCPSGARSRSSTPSRPKKPATKSNGPSRCARPKHYSSKRKRTDQ